jgi:NlpC/P60 family
VPSASPFLPRVELVSAPPPPPGKPLPWAWLSAGGAALGWILLRRAGSTGLGRAALVVCAGLVLVGVVRLLQRYQLGRMMLGAAAIGLLALLAAPSGDPHALRQSYLSALRSYRGAPYQRGGESRSGVDCSGLVRRALVRASLRRALLAGDGASLRRALEVWWYDCGAGELARGYRGLTVLVGDAPSLAAIRLDALRPGDLAVTRSGDHVLAYLGQGRWIQADPRAGAVVEGDPGEWRAAPVRVMRWKAFE